MSVWPSLSVGQATGRSCDTTFRWWHDAVPRRGCAGEDIRNGSMAQQTGTLSREAPRHSIRLTTYEISDALLNVPVTWRKAVVTSDVPRIAERPGIEEQLTGPAPPLSRRALGRVRKLLDVMLTPPPRKGTQPAIRHSHSGVCA